jgi:hypothetical protein
MVCEYFGVVPRTLHRWKNDPTLGFPPPARINKRDYHDPRLIEDFALSRRVIADHETAKKAESEPEAQLKVKPKKHKNKPTRGR